jgi:hypothetical protein
MISAESGGADSPEDLWPSAKNLVNRGKSFLLGGISPFDRLRANGFKPIMVSMSNHVSSVPGVKNLIWIK